MQMTKDRARLYLITPPAFRAEDFAPLLEEALEGGDVACLQLRIKSPSGETGGEEEILHAAGLLEPILRRRGVAFLLNDCPQLVKRCGADGAHIGQHDMAYARAREHLLEGQILGVTCHASRHLAMVAGESGADYVAFGAFYETMTKKPAAQAPLDILRWWSKTSILPSVAIGGVRVENAKHLVEAGADFLAVSSGVWDHDAGAGSAVAAFNAIFDAAAQKRPMSEKKGKRRGKTKR